MRYLAVDPGKSTGLCVFDEKGRADDFHIARGLDELMRWLEDRGPFEVVIYEDFRLFGHKAMVQVGSRMETVQAIGVLLAFVRRWGAEVHRQQPQAHKLGQMWGGMKYKGKHDEQHDIVAHNHGVYYLVRKGIRPMQDGKRMVQP